MSGPSVLIVGAGAVGLASAWHLSERGVSDITVVDAQHPASGSSGLSVGILQTQHVTTLNIELRVVAKRFFDRLAADFGLDLVRNGYVRLGFSAEQIEAFEKSVSVQRGFGITDAQVLSRSELLRLVPDMRVDDVDGGLYGPSDGYIDGHLYCGLMVEVLRQRGVSIMSRAAVLTSKRTWDGHHCVNTTRGIFNADVVVNAAGAWAPNVAAIFGTVAPLRTERHQAVMVTLPADLPYVMPCVTTYSPGSGQDGLYFRHESPGRLVAGLHSLDPIGEVVDPDSFSGTNDFEFLESVAEQFQHRLPGIGEAGLGDGWAGIYPVSEDGMALVGPSPGQPTVISACGAGGAGIMLSPVLGQLVAEWIVDGEVLCVPSAIALSPGRVMGPEQRQKTKEGK